MKAKISLLILAMLATSWLPARGQSAELQGVELQLLTQWRKNSEEFEKKNLPKMSFKDILTEKQFQEKLAEDKERVASALANRKATHDVLPPPSESPLNRLLRQAVTNLIVNVTNYYAPANPILRYIDGKQHNSKAWPTLNGDLLEVLSNGIVIQTFTMFQPTKKVITTTPTAEGGQMTDVEPREVNDGPPYKKYGPAIFIKNFVSYSVGTTVRARAIKLPESVQWRDEVLDCYDYGDPERTEVIVRTKVVTALN